MAAGADVRPEYSHSTINWVTAVFMVLFHVAAIAAFWFFSWTNVVTAIVLHWFAVGFGISLGYHRLHTHRGYKTSKAFEYFLAVCGTLSLEGGPIFWVATHRVHHQHSDHDGDPHTPRDGGFPMVLWGVFLRAVVGLHGTWLVNSATHMWGSRRFSTRDDSRNSWWVPLLTFGEGWHNNHHAHPVSARHGLAWYEFDISWITLKAFNAIGLVHDLKVARVREALPEEEAA